MHQKLSLVVIRMGIEAEVIWLTCFFGSIPNITDPSVAPDGKEALIFLVPLAPGLEDRDEIREKYYNIIMDRFEKLTGQSIRDHIIVRNL